MTAAIGLLALGAGAVAWLLARRALARRRREVTAWLAGGVEVFGGAATTRWDGARRLVVRIDQAASPFRSLSLGVALDPLAAALGAVPPLGRRTAAHRDRLLVRCELARAPRAEFDLFYPGEADGLEADLVAREGRWRVSEVGESVRAGLGPLGLAEPAGPALAPREGLLHLARRMEEASAELRRLAVRRTAPHLLAVVTGPGATGEVTPQALFDLLREAAFLALGPAVGSRGHAPPAGSQT